MDIFAKTFQSEKLGQILVMRDYCSESEKPTVEVMINYKGAVQTNSFKFETDEGADEAFNKLDADIAEKAAAEIMEALLTIGV